LVFLTVASCVEETGRQKRGDWRGTGKKKGTEVMGGRTVKIGRLCDDPFSVNPHQNITAEKQRKRP